MCQRVHVGLASSMAAMSIFFIVIIAAEGTLGLTATSRKPIGQRARCDLPREDQSVIC